MIYVCIFVPDFPVQAILRAEPGLRWEAVAVLEGKPPLQRVVGLNEKACRAGIELGMTKLQAEACPDLVLRLRSTLQETAAHAALLDCAQSFSPRVEDTAPDTVVLDIAGLEGLFGEPTKLARDLARRASDLGLEVNVAVAPNPDAAMLAARGFSGVTVIADGEEEQRLGNLPLGVLFTGNSEKDAEDRDQFLETLERWGVHNFRTFAALPEIAISERLGQRGVYLQKLARGTVSRTIIPVEPPLAFEETIELEYPLMLLEPLAFLLSRLLDQLCARLSARSLATQELRLKFELEKGAYPFMVIPSEDSTSRSEAESASRDLLFSSSAPNQFRRTLRLPLPMLDAKVFLKLLQLDLKAHPPGAPIKKIWLTAEPVRMRATQGGLFVPPSPEPEKLELTLARISGIVGKDRVGALEVLDTHRPETFRVQPFSVNAQGLKPGSKRGTANRGLMPCTTQGSSNGPVTALRIFRPRLNATISLRDGRPTHIFCLNKSEVGGEVIWQAGPWRSSGDWWEQEPWARDEWDVAVQTATGIILYRLVRDLLSGKWLVEGTYD